MGQAWHKQRRRLAAQEARASYWRTSKYRFSDAASPTSYLTSGAVVPARMIEGISYPASIEVAPGAVWQRINPFESYEPPSKERQVGAGAHLTFLNLKGVLRIRPDLFDKALLVFANRYGLLGQFEREYVPQPMLPQMKLFVAPEAVIEANGRLREVDPATEGRELIYELKRPRGNRHDVGESELEEQFELWRRQLIALPAETSFAPNAASEPRHDGELRDEQLPTFWDPLQGAPSELTSWERIKGRFGALMVLDEESPSGASVLCTREAHTDWLLHLDQFPSPDTSSAEEMVTYINSVTGDSSERAFIDEDGSLKRGWRCASLLEAMGIMLLLDMTEDSTIKKCESRGCPYYFRVGSQSKSKYCSTTCADRASTRMGRGQEP